MTTLGRAKVIAKPILRREEAQILGTNNSDNDSALYRVPLRSRTDSREPSSAGRHKNSKTFRGDNNIEGSFSILAEKISKMADAVIDDQSTHLEELLRQEIKKALASTNADIAEIKNLLLSLK